MKKSTILVLNCKKCGDEFLHEYKGKGQKPKYCENCKKLIHREAQKRYQQKHYEEVTKEKRHKKKLLTKSEIETKETFETTDFVGRMSKVLTSLDTLRVEMCTLASDMNNYQSSYDKNDQIYLHRIEDIDTDNVVETQKLIKEWQESRNNRRNVKNLIKILNDTISAIPYKSYANALPVLKGKDYIVR